MALRREEAEKAKRSVVAEGGSTLAGCPVLAEYLTATAFEDGSERPTATLLLFTEDGVWKCCLNDRANARSAWVSGQTPEECVSALEEAVSTGEVQWRRSKGMPAQGRGEIRR